MLNYENLIKDKNKQEKDLEEILILQSKKQSDEQPESQILEQSEIQIHDQSDSQMHEQVNNQNEELKIEDKKHKLYEVISILSNLEYKNDRKRNSRM